MSRFQVKIKHPEWLDHSDPAKTQRLWKERRLPIGVAGWLWVVSLKHALRAIYGSDLRAAWALLWWAILNRWDDLVSERVYRVWHLPGFALAYVVTFAWGWARKICYENPAWAFMWGRRESPEPIICRCGWAGMRRWAVHSYTDDGSAEDVEPTDECPRCGAEV